MHKNAEYMSKNEKIYLTRLKFHVQTILGSTAERRHERYEYCSFTNLFWLKYRTFLFI
jgi:hypothetical protein